MEDDSRSIVYVKNMVCPRCVETVVRIARSHGLPLEVVELGKVIFERQPSGEDLAIFAETLESSGFAVVENSKSRLISQIKTLVIERIHFQGEDVDQNLSGHLSSKLNYEYSRLSKLFSSVEGITIERYATLQRIERAKELLVYDQLSLAEISESLGYSSPPHFSNRFKRETGMTPGQFKKLRDPPRRNIDSI